MQAFIQLFFILFTAGLIIVGVLFNLVVLYYVFVYLVLPCAVLAAIIWIIRECIRQWSQPS